MNNTLSTFVLVNKDRVISPVLTTTREYGNWLEEVFPKEICDMELYIRANKSSGEKVLEKHPGTKIGQFFDKIDTNSEQLKSWFILQDCETMNRLVKLKLAQRKDAIPISVNDKLHRRMIRVYTINQIEMYVKSQIDNSFHIDKYLAVPKQVKISDRDVDMLIKPEVNVARKKLF